MNFDSVLTFDFFAAHRIYNESFPSDLHGHNFRVSIYLGADETNNDDYIISPEVIENSIINKLAYSTLLNIKDPLVNAIKPYSKVIAFNFNPTTEMLAKWIGQQIPNCTRVALGEYSYSESAWNRDEEESGNWKEEDDE